METVGHWFLLVSMVWNLIWFIQVPPLNWLNVLIKAGFFMMVFVCWALMSVNDSFRFFIFIFE